jgi:hypothetical protein
MNQTVTVKYQTKKAYCSCCEQKLPKAEVDNREIEFTVKNALDWVNWNEVVEYHEDMESMVPEFIYETISFWATDSHEKIMFEDSEVEKVKDFILREVVRGMSA